MDEIILHQYETSPFSEKVRKILALKGLAWRAVEQPIIAPKPKLTPLTGGYRRIPVLQIGADVYCDTAAIARVVEITKPEPSCFPDGTLGAAEIVAYWADHWLFMAAVPPAIFKLLDVLPAEFMKDREAMSPGFTIENLTAALPDARSRLLVGLDWLDSQLRSHDFLLGRSFSLADAACFHPLWFLRNDAESFALVTKRPALARWFERVDAMGRGEMTALDAEEALAIARRSLPLTPETSDGTDPSGVEPGDRISVSADDYGVERVSGVAVVVTASEIALKREDPAVGEVIVHFPRAGYRIVKS
ncbi:MAG: glutathione S-transferase N-terminal domain-containing protein [Candidatus Binatia bacterium]